MAFALALLAVLLRQVGQSRTRLCPGSSCHCRLHLTQVCHPFVHSFPVLQLRQLRVSVLWAALFGRDSLHDLQVNHPVLLRFAFPLIFSWQSLQAMQCGGMVSMVLEKSFAGRVSRQTLQVRVGLALTQVRHCRREGVLDFLHVAGRAGVLLPFAGLEAAVRALLLLARQARGRAVGPCLLPLRVREEVQRLGSPAGFAGGAGPGGLAEGVQVQLAAEPLEQLRDALGRAALVEPGREGAQDQHVLAAADAAGDHGAVGDVGPAVDVEVQQHRAPRILLLRACFCCFFFGGLQYIHVCRRWATRACLEQRRHHIWLRAEAQRLALAAVGRDGEGGHQGQLRSGDGQHGVLPALVELPRALYRLDRVEAFLRGSVQRPIGILELHVPASFFARRGLFWVRLHVCSGLFFPCLLVLRACVCVCGPSRTMRGCWSFSG